MIRRVRFGELDKIIEMKIEMYIEAGIEDKLADDAYSKILDSYQSLYREEKLIHFIVEENGIIVASAGGFIKEDIPYSYFKKPYYGFIGDVYTYPDYRKKGYATKLTSKIIKWFKGKEVKVVRLLASKKGRTIYEKLGFEVTDEMILNLW